MGQEMSVLKEAREIVRNQPLTLKVANLRKCADDLNEAYDLIKVNMTRASVQKFVGAFTRTMLAIEIVQAAEPTPPQGGAMPAPLAYGESAA